MHLMDLQCIAKNIVLQEINSEIFIYIFSDIFTDILVWNVATLEI